MKFLHLIPGKVYLLLLLAMLVGCSSSSSDDDDAEANVTEGSWTGTWDNITFGSDGPLTLMIVDNGDDTLTVTVDLDGFVGGAFNPDAQTITATINEDGDASFSGMVDMMGMQGQLDFTLTDDGDLTISLPDIPVAGFDSFTATGTMGATTGSLTYTVTFSGGGGTADGTAEATKS